MIRFENVTFSYSGKAEPSLSHGSFQIKPGELILLCGVSGCGKISYKVNSGEAGRGGGLGRKVNPDGGGREGALGRDGKNEVIHDISLRIEPGQTVAFVGPSGGGKSTLASLVSRFFDPPGRFGQDRRRRRAGHSQRGADGYRLLCVPEQPPDQSVHP